MSAEQLLLEDSIKEHDSLLALIAGDPIHARDRAAVVDAIRTVARAHAGVIDQNEVRRAIPTWVYPKVVGAVYNALKTAGHIVKYGQNESDDRDSGNAGRLQRTYKWVGRP